jgi:CDP-Glycerol:Poly(glycerophosphate) glycerophosphotransferase
MSFFLEYRNAKTILAQRHPIIFYSENRYSYQYFEKLINDLLHQTELPILYITSDKTDPLLSAPLPRMQVVYIKSFLGWTFLNLKADVIIMTMPDLNNFLYKKSDAVTCYIYMFHAAVSLHQQYNEKAFFHYDAFFCTGQYQTNELKRLEKEYFLIEKDSIPYGYPLFDAIKKKYTQRNKTEEQNKTYQILIAPSWYPSCIFETCMEELIQQLIKLPYKIFIRPHPEYIKRSRKKYSALKKKISKIHHVYFDESADIIQSLIQTDLLITDRSGIAFEYAFGTCRPILFIDTPPKISNQQWQKIGINPIENKIRAQIGFSILPTDLSTIHQKINQLKNSEPHFANEIKRLQEILFFNKSDSYKRGIDYILSKITLL